MKKLPRRSLLDVINVPRYIALHVFGCHHTHAHRIFFGLLLMIAGVMLSKQFEHQYFLHFLCDISGYGIHGMGLIPIVDFVQMKSQKR